MAKTAADKKKVAPAKKTQHSKISVTLGRKRGKKGGKSAADDDAEEQLFEPMPDHYPGVSNKPVTCLTAASPFWELEDMRPAAAAEDAADGTAGKSDDANSNQEEKDASVVEVGDDDSVSELIFGTSNNKGTSVTSASKHKKDAAAKIGGRLRPGQALQRCSGADVMLSKSAMNRPNLAKSKGRYLIILPGGLYPRVPDSEERERLVKAQKVDGSDGVVGSSADTNAEDTTKQSNEKKVSSKGEDDVEIVEGATATPIKPAPFTPSTAPSVLGQLQKLGTDTPILRVPFPDGRVMLLKGRKVSLTTSYMALTCKSTGRGGQGTVTCKDIFAGAIVFGDIGWEDNGAAADAAAVLTAADESRSAQHYGPSERTIDGGRAVKGQSSRYSSSVRRGTSSLSRNSTSSPMQLSEGDVGDGDDDLGSDSSPILHDDDTDDDDDDDEAFVGKVSDSPVVKRQASSRRSGVRVNYADMIKNSDAEEDDDDVSDENGGVDDDSSVEEVIPAKKKRSPPKKPATPKATPKPKAASTKKKSPATTSSTTKKTPRGKKSSKKADSESDYDDGVDDDVIAVDVASGASKTPCTSRQRKKISYVENSEGSDEDDDEAFSEEGKNTPSTKKKDAAKTPTSGKRGGTSAKNKVANPTSSKKKAAVKVSKPKSEPIEIDDNESEEKKVDDTTSLSAAKAAPRSPEPSSAARRRKKKISPKKSPSGGSAKKRKLDLMDNDDEFAFLG